MNCQHIADDELLEKYLNGRLDQAVQDDLEVHILECPECLARAEALSSIRAGLSSKVHRSVPPVTARRRQLAWWAAAAALLLVCIFGFYHFRSRTPEQPQATGRSPQPAHAEPVPPTTAHDSSAEVHARVGKGPSEQKHPAVAKNSANPAVAEATTATGSTQGQNTVSAAANSQQVAAGQHKGPEAGPAVFDFAHHNTSMMEMSQGTNVELYALAAVQPPPYASSNSSKGNNSDPSDTTAAFSPGQLPDGRTVFQIAIAAYREKRYTEAAHLLEDVVKADPEKPDANFYLAICRLVQGRPEDSIAPLRAVIAVPASPLTQSAHFYLAKAYLRTGDMAAAEDEMRAAAGLPGNLTREAQSIADRIHVLRGAKTTHDQDNIQSSPHK